MSTAFIHYGRLRPVPSVSYRVLLSRVCVSTVVSKVFLYLIWCSILWFFSTKCVETREQDPYFERLWNLWPCVEVSLGSGQVTSTHQQKNLWGFVRPNRITIFALWRPWFLTVFENQGSPKSNSDENSFVTKNHVKIRVHNFRDWVPQSSYLYLTRVTRCTRNSIIVYVLLWEKILLSISKYARENFRNWKHYSS